jgi:hypothetical protein
VERLRYLLCDVEEDTTWKLAQRRTASTLPALHRLEHAGPCQNPMVIKGGIPSPLFTAYSFWRIIQYLLGCSFEKLGGWKREPMHLSWKTSNGNWAIDWTNYAIAQFYLGHCPIVLWGSSSPVFLKGEVLKGSHMFLMISNDEYSVVLQQILHAASFKPSRVSSNRESPLF